MTSAGLAGTSKLLEINRLPGFISRQAFSNSAGIGTGDLSELALGWCTYNGDHMSMYAVNTGVPKTLIQYLVRWVADQSSADVRDVPHERRQEPAGHT